jgi:hypothetical protein
LPDHDEEEQDIEAQRLLNEQEQGDSADEHELRQVVSSSAPSSRTSPGQHSNRDEDENDVIPLIGHDEEDSSSNHDNPSPTNATRASNSTVATQSSTQPVPAPSQEEEDDLPESIVIVQPDGSYCMAIDPIKAEASAAARAEARRLEEERRQREEPQSFILAAGPGGFRRIPFNFPRISHIAEEVDFETTLPSFELLLQWRRKRSLMFLLSMDICYLLLILLITMSLEEGTSTLVLLLHISNMLLDLFGISATLRDSERRLGAFLTGMILLMVTYGFVEFTPLFLVRIVILLLAFQYKVGVKTLKLLVEEEIEERTRRGERVPGAPPPAVPPRTTATATATAATAPAPNANSASARPGVAAAAVPPV